MLEINIKNLILIYIIVNINFSKLNNLICYIETLKIRYPYDASYFIFNNIRGIMRMVFGKPPTDQTLEWFLSHCHTHKYPSKSTLIHHGEKAETLYYIVKGSVAVLIKDEEGKEMILSYLNQGDFIGELGLFEEGQERTAWVRAKSVCEVAEISYKKFRLLIQVNSDILMRLSAQMAKRLQTTSEKVGSLAFLDVTGRIAQTLLNLAKQPDAMTHPDGMQIKITRQEIGQIVGCSRETVGRILKMLEDQDLISAHGKTIVVYGTR